MSEDEILEDQRGAENTNAVAKKIRACIRRAIENGTAGDEHCLTVVIFALLTVAQEMIEIANSKQLGITPPLHGPLLSNEFITLVHGQLYEALRARWDADGKPPGMNT